VFSNKLFDCLRGRLIDSGELFGVFYKEGWSLDSEGILRPDGLMSLWMNVHTLQKLTE